MVFRTRFDLISPLRREEVVRRLGANIDSGWRIFGEKSIVGYANRTAFRLRVRSGYRNSFQTYLFGQLLDERGGTRLKCRAGMHPVVIAFMTVWFSLVGFVLAASISDFVRAAPAMELSAFQLIPAAMAVFGFGLIWVGRWLARGELDELRAFLAQTLDATPAR